jgi:hypothetical protein
MKIELDPEWSRKSARLYRHERFEVSLHIDVPPALPAGAQIDVVAQSTVRSSTGWPVDLAEQRVSLPTGAVEHQLHARYHIFDSLPVVVIAGAAHRSALDAILLSAQPDASPPAPCLAMLLADVEP